MGSGIRIAVKKYWKMLLAFALGITFGLASWQLWIVPQYPILIIDPEAPVEHDIYGIGYLPVELTGKSKELGIPVRVCVVPAAYKDFVHSKDGGVVESADKDVVKAVQDISWIVVGAGVGAIVGLVIYKKKKRGKIT